MSSLLTKEQKARARSFVAGLKKLKKDLGFKEATKFAAYIGQPATTVKGWLNNSLPTEEKMAKVVDHLIGVANKVAADFSALRDFIDQA